MSTSLWGGAQTYCFVGRYQSGRWPRCRQGCRESVRFRLRACLCLRLLRSSQQVEADTSRQSTDASLNVVSHGSAGSCFFSLDFFLIETNGIRTTTQNSPQSTAWEPYLSCFHLPDVVVQTSRLHKLHENESRGSVQGFIHLDLLDVGLYALVEISLDQVVSDHLCGQQLDDVS